MNKINEFFSDLGGKMPFAADFFRKNIAVSDSFAINSLFMILVALVVVLIALIVIIVCVCKVKKRKKDGATTAAPAEDTAHDAAASDNAPVVLDEAPVEEAEASAAEVTPVEATASEDSISAEAAAPAESAEVAADVDDIDVAAPTAAPTTESSDEPSPIKEEAPQMKKEEPAATAKPKKEVRVFGTFEVSLCMDGYRFYLFANNKQLLYESVGFTSEEGAMKGIETFRKTVIECPYIITKDKYDRYRYVFNKRYQGENYSSKQSAQSAAESVKRWAANAKVIVRPPKPEELEAYKTALAALRTKDDVDWNAVAEGEANARKMGKFTVEEDGNQDEVIGYRFYLIANNAQILYTSALYASAASALKGIDAFKKAVYIGNFYVDEDKFGHFRYILRSSPTTTYVGESYETRARAESSIESVKKFVQCAVIVPFKKGADAE